MSFTLFSKLPPDLRAEIVRNCAPNDQLALGRSPYVLFPSMSLTLIARASKISHEEIVPIMYFHVDISLHNDAGLFPGHFHEPVFADNPLRVDYDVQDKCEERQQLFFEAINLHPQYGSYVVRLSWTCFSREEPENDERQITEEPMWKTFGMLRNVAFLDFASLASHREQVAPPLPPALFSQVTHLRLSGQMSWALVKAIIDSVHPTQLISLECNNLQDFGQLRDGVDLDSSINLSDFPESDHSSDVGGLRHPGATRGHLRRLEGNCSKLRHLCLRSVGQDDENDDRWSPILDRARYKEWASFINSVRPTIQTLIVEEGREFEQTNILHCRGLGPFGSPKQVGRPMDTRFSEYLLPVLSTGSWPRLRYMGVYGIGTRPRYSNLGFVPGSITTSSVRHILSESSALSNVQVDIRDEARQTYFMRMQGLFYEDAS